MGAMLLFASSMFAWKTDATFKNETHGQQVFLYSDGTCVVRTEDGRGTGTYEISGAFNGGRGTIKIKWDNGATQQGTVVVVEKYVSKVRSVHIEGVRYDNTSTVVKRGY